MRETHAMAAPTGIRQHRWLFTIIYNIHALMMAQLLKIKKPTVGFSARFFFEAQISWKILTDNDLLKQKSNKTCKSAK